MSHISASNDWRPGSNAWAVSLAIGAIGVLYQIIVGEVLEESGSRGIEHAVDLILFGVVNPALAFWGWTVVARARQTERVLAAINVASPDAIIRLDPEGRIEFWSAQAEVLLGYSAKQANGRTLGELLGPPGAPIWARLRDMVRSSGLVRGQRAVCPTLGGGEIPVELSASPVRDELGRPQGMLVVLRDIRGGAKHTEMIGHLSQRLHENVEQLARTNAEREQANCMQLELVSFASHEIRGPLGNIRSATERMYRECDEVSPICQRMFGLINRQLGHVDELVRSVLGAANIEAGKLVLHREPMSVMAAMREVAQAMNAVDNTRPIRLSVSMDLPPVDADRERVVAVLRNLLGNADKYSPQGAEIILAAEGSAGYVTLCVRDNGPGLPDDDLERIFDKCFRGLGTRGVDGYGLGLYICRQVVAAHGGKIWAENDPGRGAVFSFTLPIAS